MALTLPGLILVVLSAWGFWTLWGFPYTNGLLKMLGDLQKPGALLINTSEPMKTHYTGVKVIDRQLTVLVAFFYTATDGNRADVSLHGLDLGGQVIAAWTLIVVESMRQGNKGKLITYSMTLGFLLQNIGFACIAPLWMALHLATSPTVSGSKARDIVVDPLRLKLIPFSIATGYIFPSVIMTLAAPTTISFETKQNWTAIQQLWPLWTTLTQELLTFFAQASTQTTGFESDNRSLLLRAFRPVYAFAILSSAAGHLVAWLLAALAALFPVLFNPAYAAQMQPSHVFLPKAPFPPAKAAVLADGALWFLQWDQIVGTASVLLWALTLGAQAKKRDGGLSVKDILLAALMGLAVGPAGTAVVTVWLRDELVFKREKEGKRRD